MTDTQTPLDDYDDYAKRPVPASELEDVPEDDFAKRPVAPTGLEEVPEDDYAKRPALPQDEQPTHSALAAPLQPAPSVPSSQKKPRRNKWLLPLVAACAVVVAGVALWQSGALDQTEPSTPTDLTYYTGEDVPDGADVGISTLPDWVADSASTEAESPVADAAVAESAATGPAVREVVEARSVIGDYVITSYSDNTCSIVGYTGSSQNLVIPNLLNGYQVTAIEDEAFFRCNSLTSVTIPSSVTAIGKLAFAYCQSLTTINIPSSITSIGTSAFSTCKSLENVYIPHGVITIGDYAFDRCTSLSCVTIPSSVANIGDDAFFACHALATVYVTENSHAHQYCIENNLPLFFTDTRDEVAAPPQVLMTGVPAGDYMITTYSDDTCVITMYNGTAAHLTIPGKLNGYSVAGIGTDAFYNCSSLTSVSIPDSVSHIGVTAFFFCNSLTNIDIPDSVTSIGNGAFSNCYALTSVTIPDNVTSIGEEAFYDCDALTAIYVTENSYAHQYCVENGLPYQFQ